MGMLAIYIDSFTVAFVNIRKSSRECITWYTWCLGMEASYGKANPHTAQYMYSMKTTLLQWYKKLWQEISHPIAMRLVSHN